MSGTVKTNAQLYTEFADGQVAGSITPGDVRDFIASETAIQGTTQTASYTAALTDAGQVVDMNAAGAINFTVPTNAAVALAVGTLLTVCQYGAGQVTLVPSGGVTLRTATGTLTTRAQYSTVSLRQRAANEWVVSGDLT